MDNNLAIKSIDMDQLSLEKSLFEEDLETLRKASYPYSTKRFRFFRIDNLTKHQDLFTFCVIGGDLKIQLKASAGLQLNQSEALTDDYTLLNRIERYFAEESISEILFDDAMKASFNSNKHRISIPFLLRNSHILQLFKNNSKTYMRITEHYKCDMFDKEIKQLLSANRIHDLSCKCLIHFLKNFSSPINTGKLQSCFLSVLDASFFSGYKSFFNFASPVVSLKENIMFDNESVDSVRDRFDELFVTFDENKENGLSNPNPAAYSSHRPPYSKL